MTAFPLADSKKLDLNDLLIKHPSATFFLKAASNALVKEGIRSGDILIVDRSLTPTPNSIVIAVVDGELVLGKVKAGSELWGVVTAVIHKL
jgi:DNA polymerase V